MLRLSFHAVQCVLHIVFLQFRKVVRHHDCRTYHTVAECNKVIVRIIYIVGTFISDGIKTVQCVRNVAYREETPVISFHGSIRPVLQDCRIRQVLIKHDGRTLYRHQCAAIPYDTSNGHGINDLSGRECKRITRIHVAFIVVSNGVRQIQSIRRIRFQVRLEIHDQGFASDLIFRGFFQRRREEYALCILDRDIFIESNDYLRVMHRNIDSSRQR